MTEDEGQLATLLLWAIAVLTVASLVFTMNTFILRVLKIRRLKQIRILQAKAEELLFPLLFSVTSVEETIEQYRSLPEGPLLKSVMTRLILSLHRNYSGVQKALLEQFFVESKLYLSSERKLNSRKWDSIISGIREVSMTNVQSALPKLKKLLHHKKLLVRKEAFVGMLTLSGTPVLSSIKLPDFLIDDWTQSCILHNLSLKQQTSFEGLEVLLESDNESLVLLGFRIIEYFQLYSYYGLVSQYDKSFTSRRMQSAVTSIQNRVNAQLI